MSDSNPPPEDDDNNSLSATAEASMISYLEEDADFYEIVLYDENYRDPDEEVDLLLGATVLCHEEDSNITDDSSKCSEISMKSNYLNPESPLDSSALTKIPENQAESEDDKKASEHSCDGSSSGRSDGEPKVPPLTIVIPQQNSPGCMDSNLSNSRHAALPYVVPSNSRCGSPACCTNTDIKVHAVESGGATPSVNSGNENCTKVKDYKSRSAIVEPRVLRSSHRPIGSDSASNNPTPQQQRNLRSATPLVESTINESIEESTDGLSNIKDFDGNKKKLWARKSATQTFTGNVTKGNFSSSSASSKSWKESTKCVVPLRKRKILINKTQEESTSKTSTNTKNTNETCNETDSPRSEDHPVMNCYQIFLNIRKNIEEKHRSLKQIQPSPPPGFEEYLMNRKTYVLARKTNIEPVIIFPDTLPAHMNDLFSTQERERFKLKMQHIVEREKLVLTLEQEIIRVHGNAERSSAHQSVPFSACTILNDQEVYNEITPEQEENKNVRSRYNRRLFLSWLQDLDDKWNKIKEDMIKRHRNEAQSLHAIQKMNWQWSLSTQDYKLQIISENHVPIVYVNEVFDMLPAQE